MEDNNNSRTAAKNDSKCYICKGHNIKKDDNLEFKYIYSEKSQYYYYFIICIFCTKKIFYKKLNENDNSPLNRINGINIKCPFQSCGKYFFLTTCPEYKEHQKIEKEIKEGEIIKCGNEKCGYEYIQIRCPIANCYDINYFSKPKNYSNTGANAITYNHKKILLFQKINCHFCVRPIVYKSDKKEINRYFDSMKVVCPYDDCKKSFNRIICAICSEVNIIEGGYYFMGNRIQCSKCKSFFGNILCPKCLRINPLIKNFFKSGYMICRYSECEKKSYIVNCIHCQRMNVFNEKVPIPGQKIKCAYEDCGKEFNEVYCPSCNKLNPFFNGDFAFGKSYKCLYTFCSKFFQFFVCPNCFIYSRTSEKQEGKKYTCNKCKTLLCNWRCPFCKNTILDKNSTLQYGQMVKCPSCTKKYSFCRCFECQKLIFSEENQYILGTSVICQECSKYSVNTVCPGCGTKISFLDRIDDMINGEKIHCSKCEKEFQYFTKGIEMTDEKEIYSQNLIALSEIIKGERVQFGKNTVDENYKYFENSLINGLYDEDSRDNKSQLTLNKKSN